MIAVIADDLSGAAELANAAVDAGLVAEVQIGRFTGSTADVVCVDTQTRLRDKQEAASIAGGVAQSFAAVRPELVYKKCDSVLRGPVAAESLAIARALGKTRVLLVPANPSRRRTISGGDYFVEGMALNKTAFAADPEQPRLSASVAELVGDIAGIETPDTVTVEDVARHAASVDANTLPAGAVDFFNELLAVKLRPGRAAKTVAREPAGGLALFVCGSNAAWLTGREAEAAAHGVPAFPMPPGFFEQELPAEKLTRWAGEVEAGLRQDGAALLAIGGGKPGPGLDSEMLAERLAQLVELVLKSRNVDRVFLEGGATASAVIRRLGLERFAVEQSPGAGVGALRPIGRPGSLFLIKPGSYAWPEAVWRAVVRR